MQATHPTTAAALPIARDLLIARFEGCAARVPATGLFVPYLCPAGYWTIGFGRLVAREHQPITADEARAFLTLDALAHIAAAARLSPSLLTGTAGRLAAIGSFVFNLGAGAYAGSTLRRRVDAADWPRACDEIGRWTRGGGRVLRGLVLRRAAEAVFLRDGYGR